MHTFNVKTHSHSELIDITSQVNKAVQESSVKNGVVLVYTPHTTAAVTINENADPDVQTDLLTSLRSLKFDSLPYRHMEGNSASHIQSSLIGCSEQVILDNGQLVLGTWQGIYFCEFDGPRNRRVIVTITG